MKVYQENTSWNNNIYQHKYEDTSRRMIGLFTLFSKWKGSVMKLLYHNLMIFLLLYYTLHFIYKYIFLFNPVQKESFELVCVYVGRNMDKIPLTFLIGFYVQKVVSRWWSMFTVLPYPDRIALKLISFCPGKVICL